MLGKSPFLVRISCHEGSPIFHKEAPDHAVLINTTVPEKDRERYQEFVTRYRELSKMLISCLDHEIDEHLAIMRNIDNSIDVIKKNAIYSI